MNRPAWFVAILLAMLAVLMASHLRLLHVGIEECDRLFQVQLEQLQRLARQQQQQVTIRPENSECSDLEADYEKVANQYIGVILALLGGAGVAAGAGRPPGP